MKTAYEKPDIRCLGNLRNGLTFHECATCDITTSPSMEGYSALITSTGYTQHFCSSACVRAYVNRVPHETVIPWINIVCTVGMVLAVAIALAL